MDADLFDSRVTSALIGGLVVAAGWFVSGLRALSAARRARRERERDLRTALDAEIGRSVEALLNFDLDAAWREVVLRMERDETYAPFVPSERGAVVFLAMLKELPVLPAQVIRPVVAYYSQVMTIEALIADMRLEAVNDLPQSERIRLYTDYIGLKQGALDLGKTALIALSGEGRLAQLYANRRPVEGSVAASSPGAGPSAP